MIKVEDMLQGEMLALLLQTARAMATHALCRCIAPSD